jgi:hypothetical protein
MKFSTVNAGVYKFSKNLGARRDILNDFYVKLKSKAVPLFAMQVLRGSGGIARKLWSNNVEHVRHHHGEFSHPGFADSV